jgi:hypothetical protein
MQLPKHFKKKEKHGRKDIFSKGLKIFSRLFHCSTTPPNSKSQACIENPK